MSGNRVRARISRVLCRLGLHATRPYPWGCYVVIRCRCCGRKWTLVVRSMTEVSWVPIASVEDLPLSWGERGVLRREGSRREVRP